MKYLGTLSSVLAFLGFSFAEGLDIRVSAGKTQYLAEEPIYFKVLLVNDSKKPIAYNSPLSIGLGSFTFCEEKSNACVKDQDLFNTSLKAPIVGNMAPGHAYRIIGSLNHDLQAKLIGSRPGRKRIFVKADLVSDPTLQKTRSEAFDLEIVQAQPEDDSLIKNLAKYAPIGFADNSQGSRIYSPSTTDYPAEEEVLTILEKHRSSRLFPYALSYLADYPAIRASKGKSEKAKRALASSWSQDESIFGAIDPYLRIQHSFRCIKQGRTEASGVSRQTAEACKMLILESLKGTKMNGILKEKGIAADKIEDYDFVKFLRPEVFSAELDYFLANGTFKTDWKMAP